MKFLKNIFIIATAFFTLATTFVGCKKGDGDPFISLYSRKARVVGKWKLSSGTEVDKSTSSGSTTTITIEYDGTKADLTIVDGSGTTTDNYGYTEEWEYKKDGTFSATMVEDGSTTTVTGVWNFTGGVGDLKNKEQIVLTYLLITDASGTYTYSGIANDETFDIYELKNKEMIFKQQRTFAGTNNTSEYTIEKTFVQ